MKKKTHLSLGISALSICLICGTLYAFLKPSQSVSIPQQSTERIHLALRRTAHLLLKQAGDSTSRIAPVKQTGDRAYLVQLDHAFNYDSLPSFLRQILDYQQIMQPYDVAVRRCNDAGLLLLGYSSPDYLTNKDVPCFGREQTKDCLNFSVTFKDPSVKKANTAYLWLILGNFLVLALTTVVYFFLKNRDKTQPITPSVTTDSVEKTAETHVIYTGKTVFDTRNQTLRLNNVEQKLTFQEAQLLQLFCQHKNALLERNFLLKTVWNDDGVLITRSLDVFVSRLRKLLKSDDSLKIVNVHNRGYRLETGDL
jgi:DNA-binding winged helix-turn-helix (wHTH) protein